MKDFTVHMIVKNEDQWIWYAIASVIEKAAQLLIYDTASTDNTVKIIKTFSQSKVIFEEKGEVNAEQLVKLRQEQLLRTKTEWFLLVDGDEVWKKDSLNNFQKAISRANSHKKGVVFRTRVCLGDLFHFQEEKAGRYYIAGHQGHINIRGYKKDKLYSWRGIYPDEAYVDINNLPLQECKDKLIFLDDYYWHLTHLKRSSVVKNPKRKLEIGYQIPKVLLPEVFYSKRPSIIQSPWEKYSLVEFLASSILTPLRKIKRNIFN